MNPRLRSIISNGLPYGIVLFALSFLISHYTFHIAAQRSLLTSVLTGLAAWLVNGLLYKRINASVKQLESISIHLYSPEQLVRQAPANHTIEDSLVPGKLFITDRRLIFKPFKPDGHKLKQYSWDVDEYTWDLNCIEPVAFSKSVWNAGGGFSIQTADNELFRFEVDELRSWKKMLRR